MTHKHIIYSFCIVLSAAVAVFGIQSCSTTSALPEGEQLFTGLRHIKYVNYDDNDHARSTQAEMESALASAPNGALFGSSYYRTPFPLRQWIWNAFARDSAGVGHWLATTFGSQPKLMSQVNPALRSQIATGQLRKYGYFNGKVDYKNITLSNHKKGKIEYTVDMGPLWRYDSISYIGFDADASHLIDSTSSDAVVKYGDPFQVSNLDAERQRISSVLRNNGYYYYEKGMASYLADTIANPGRVGLKFVVSDSLNGNVLRKWYIGRLTVNYRRSFVQQLTDSINGRFLTTRFSGRRPPVRLGVFMHDNELRPRHLYRASDEENTRQNLQKTGLFSYINIGFTPRDTTSGCDTLDVNYDLVFDKPYDFYIEANAKGKTTNRIGPEVVVGLTKRNAFKGAEVLDINLHGSYEWTTGHKSEGSSDGFNSYEYGAGASVKFPRVLTPQSLFSKRRAFGRPQLTDNRNKEKAVTDTTKNGGGTVVPRFRRHRRSRIYGDASTTLKASFNVLNRASYFKRHVISGELTYDWYTSANSHHSFSPLTLSYEYMNSRTQAFDSLIAGSPYLQISMRDQFVPKMSYTYSYTSPAGERHPVSWQITASEAGNVVNAAYMAFGKKWGKNGKELFKNPFAQFVKLETDFVKTWTLTENSTLVGHLNAGVILSYGNTNEAPYYEQFYIGGANSVRAFNVRSIGPGKYTPANGRFSYIDQTGDIKFLANLEYRPRLFGDLFGALFVDAGNVWTTKNDATRHDGQFKAGFMKQMAIGTGVGLRYDMGMFVIRLDWGIGLHVPYETGRNGFYNIRSFHDGQSLHLAVGYPF